MKLENLKNNQFWILEEGYYQGRLKTIKKSPEQLQPIYEGFINTLEAVKLSKQKEKINKTYKVSIRLFLTKSTVENEFNFQHIEVEDNGIGFNNENFKRFFILDDDRKFPNNKGTGRVQYIRFFDKVEFLSIYRDKTSKTGYKSRTFHFSENYLKPNQQALIRHIETKDISAKDSKTVAKFTNLLIEKDYNVYKTLIVSEIKQRLLDHYLLYLCNDKSELPEIKLEEYHDKKLQKELTLFIKQEDIPNFDKNWDIDVSYSKMSQDNKIEKDNKSEKFEIKSFVIPKEQLPENNLLLTSKGQRVNTKIKLEILQNKENIKREADPRGELLLIDRKEFKKRNKDPKLSPDEPEILLDDSSGKSQ